MANLIGDLHISRHHSINDFSRSEWDGLLGARGFYGSHSWLRATEHHETFATSYVSARDSTGKLIAAFPIYTSLQHPEEQRFDPSLLFGALTTERLFPATIVGLRAGYLTDFPFAGNLGKEDSRRVLSALASASMSENVAGSFSWLYISSSVLTRLSPALPAHPPALLSEAGAVLRLSWDAFDGYLTAQRTSRRHKIRRDLAAFGRSGCTISFGRLSEYYEECLPLVVALQRRHGAFESVSVFRQRLRDQALALGDSSVLLLCRLRGKLVGFSLFYQWGNQLYARIAGFDYDRLPADSRAYFSLAFYEPITYALSRGIDVIDYGIGSTVGKVVRGAVLEPRWSVLWDPGGTLPAGRALSHNERAREEILQSYRPYVGAFTDDLWGAASWQRMGVLKPADP
jgi:uncharacterized protein